METLRFCAADKLAVLSAQRAAEGRSEAPNYSDRAERLARANQRVCVQIMNS